MKLQIGSLISNLRKSENLTQKSLAELVGVSAAAVSKWETVASYPDITLLAPIARALGTNVNVLLSFEAKLSGEQVGTLANEVADRCRNCGARQALELANELLYEYPNCNALKFNLAAVVRGLPIINADDSVERGETESFAKIQLEEILASGDAALCASAAHMLASIKIAEGDLDGAEAILNELPKAEPAPVQLLASIRSRQGRVHEARELLQSALFQTLNIALTYLCSLADKTLCESDERAIQLLELHKKLSELFAMKFSMSDGLLAEVYLRKGEADRAVELLIDSVDAIETAESAFGDNELFYEIRKKSVGDVPLIKDMLLQDITNDLRFSAASNRERYGELLRKLQKQQN
ncbi:MAG: helix-turn-helix transcriptional regulator [Oscillospiraceae bacterium]